jgi:hypothetical protein
MKKLVILPLIALFFAGCDKVEKPLKDDFGFVELPKGNKTVLIEEFTGTSCTFCPNGARRIEGYIQQSPENIVTVAIHASGFAIPNDKTPYDFRTDEAKELYDKMSAADKDLGLPGGMFDRRGYPDEVYNHPSTWDEIIQEQLAIDASFSMTGNLEYNSATEVFTLEAGAIALDDLPATELYMVGYLVEDSIVAIQYDNNVYINDYVHNHVFRKSFTGMDGVAVSSGPISKDQIFNKKFTLQRTPTNGKQWRVEKCSAVVFVYDRNTQEVFEAHYVKLNK